MSITDETLRLTARLRRDLQAVTDRQSRDLIAAWARAWDDIAGDLSDAIDALVQSAADGRVSRTAAARSERLRRGLQLATDELTTLVRDARLSLIGDLQGVVDDAGRAQQAIIGSQLPRTAAGLVVAWDRVDERAVKAIVKRSTEQITALTRPLPVEATAAMRRELIRGVAVGANPRVVARRMLLRTEGRFNGGLNRTLVIARTEMLSAHRSAAAEAHRANADVLTGWVWTASLDKRTCPSCLAMHGSEHPLDEDGPDDHQQGRCARTPLTKSWRDLGIDLDEPASVLPDARDWFDALPEADQTEVMGAERLKLLSCGQVAWEDLSTKRSTAGWRASYAPTTVTVLRERASA